MTNGGLEEAWREQRLWSLTANRLKASIDRARNATLALTILGAVLGALAVQLQDVSSRASQVLGALAGAAVAMVAFVGRGTSTDAVSRWTRARSVSEALKTELYSCLGGGSRYQTPEPERELRRRARQITSDAEDLLPETAETTVDAEPPPEVDGIDSYVEHRVNEQIDGYYRPKAVLYQRRLRGLRKAELGLSAGGALIGVLAASGVTAAAVWVPLLTTIAAVIATHAAAARYQRMVLEYLRTADQLTDLRGRWRDEELTAGEFIDACENAISVENQGWMVRWNKTENRATPAPEHPPIPP